MFETNQVRQMLRMRSVCTKLGVSRSTVYSWVNPQSPYFDETFPKPLRLGAKSVGWDSNALDSWIDSRDTAGSGHCNAAGGQK